MSRKSIPFDRILRRSGIPMHVWRHNRWPYAIRQLHEQRHWTDARHAGRAW